MIDPMIKNNRWLLNAGLVMLIYGIIEIGDCLYLFPMQVGWVPDLYPAFVFQEIEHLLTNNPIFLFPLFAFFSTGRIMAGYGVLHNRLWGFWLGIFISTSTIIWAVFFIPLSVFEILVCLFIVAALLLGYLKNQPLIPIENR